MWHHSYTVIKWICFMHVHPAAPTFKLNCKKILWREKKYSGPSLKFLFDSLVVEIVTPSPHSQGSGPMETSAAFQGTRAAGVNLVRGLWGPQPPTGRAQLEARTGERREAMPGTRGESVRGVNRGANTVLTCARLAVVM